jgi:hypothetical protein
MIAEPGTSGSCYHRFSILGPDIEVEVLGIAQLTSVDSSGKGAAKREEHASLSRFLGDASIDPPFLLWQAPAPGLNVGHPGSIPDDRCPAELGSPV